MLAGFGSLVIGLENGGCWILRSRVSAEPVASARTLRCTPAMAAGVTDRLWSLGELIEAALTKPRYDAALPLVG